MVRKKVVFSDTDMMKGPECTCHHEKSWCEVHMSTKKESPHDALIRLFEEMGCKFVTVKLTKKQQREWDKRDKEIEKFLEDKYTSQENAKKCKMVFKSGIRTVQTPASARRVAAVKCANHGKVNGNTSSKQKTAISVKLPKNWGKVRVGKCLVQF